jgi:hypothetical protein
MFCLNRDNVRCTQISSGHVRQNGPLRNEFPSDANRFTPKRHAIPIATNDNNQAPPRSSSRTHTCNRIRWTYLSRCTVRYAAANLRRHDHRTASATRRSLHCAPSLTARTHRRRRDLPRGRRTVRKACSRQVH